MGNLRVKALLCTAVLAAGLGRADEVKLPLDVSSQDALAAGSEIGAGIDPNAGQEITRPSDIASLKTGLRTVGGVFQNGKGSAALQLNPFLLFYGREREYRAMVRARESLGLRWLEDLAVTAVLSAGTPNGGDPSRFSTLGLGVTTELLGTRSPFSPEFDACVNGPDWAKREQELLDAMPPIADSNQPDYPAKRKAAEDALESAMRAQIERCRERTRSTHQALYLTLGGRWVGPGQARQPDDAVVRVDRELVGVAYELPPVGGLRLAAQARWIGQRPADDAALGFSIDAGLSLQWANDDISLAAEATRSTVLFDGSSSFASIAATLKIRLPGRLVLGLQVQGRGNDLGPAVRHPVAAVSIAYSDHVILQKKLAVP